MKFHREADNDGRVRSSGALFHMPSRRSWSSISDSRSELGLGTVLQIWYLVDSSQLLQAFENFSILEKVTSKLSETRQSEALQIDVLAHGLISCAYHYDDAYEIIVIQGESSMHENPKINRMRVFHRLLPPSVLYARLLILQSPKIKIRPAHQYQGIL